METNEKSRVLDMTRGNPFRLVLKFALPLFFGNLLQQFYNLADTAIAGHVPRSFSSWSMMSRSSPAACG